jgi:multiple sugar transport system substrate-binding protein
MNRKRLLAGIPLRVMVAVAGLLLVSCGEPARRIRNGRTVVTVWAHAGQASERRVLRDQVQRWNASQSDLVVELKLLPEGSYNAQIQAASLADELPDVMEFDGPLVYHYAWQGHLGPLDTLVSAATRANLIPSMLRQGTLKGRLFSVGQSDSGLGLYARRSRLQAGGIRIPAGPADAWNADEFESALARLVGDDPDGAVLDLKLNYRGEWFTYAFAPVLESAGGGLIDLDVTPPRSTGRLDSPASVSALSRIQAWIRSGYVDPNVDDHAFVGGRVALSWVGHWEYGRYRDACGDDLLILPLPDFGTGTRTGQGSWNWGISRRAADPQASARFLDFLLEDAQVLEMTEANGAVPATRSAIRKSRLYGRGGPLSLFADQLRSGVSVPRPRTPAYPVITALFQRAFQDIRNGAPVAEVLARTARKIDRDVDDNEGYVLASPDEEEP